MKQLPEKYSTGTLTTKRQVTVPMAICERLGVDAGDMIGFVVTAEGKVELVNFDEIAILTLREKYGEKFSSFSKEDIQAALNAVKAIRRGTKNNR
jgi:bifunctional DNA-binding transcriptional regulator/antitoxin component of YhaV-PrlF toxin-antitoxin module